MNNFGAFISQFQQFMQNPAQLLSIRGLPQNALQDPRGAVQQLMDNGKLSQQQLSILQQRAQMIQNNPLFQQLIKKAP